MCEHSVVHEDFQIVPLLFKLLTVVLEDVYKRQVDYQLQHNTDFLCVLGTTAETPTLAEEEKKKIKKMVIERVNGKIPILLGVEMCIRDSAMRMYNGIKTMQIIGEIRYTDDKSKGVGNPSLNDSDLLRELVFKILH